ncbi:MAG: alpha-L-fucosidase [Actinomycetota bacterium]
MGAGGGHWFDGARFGMFIHWTHVSNRGFELSWPLVGSLSVYPHSGGVSVDDYYAKALKFSPEPGAAKQWMDLAADAGMKYAVLTTKHHDGFALWPTKHSEFSIAHTPYGGDLVGEYVEAAREAGLRVGFYYSLSDWHHPDYPPFREEDKPYMKYLGRRSDSWNAYLDAMFGQVRELLTNYGQIDVMWFDGQWERTQDEWKAPELAAMVRELQPQILINDRLPKQGDYATPEQAIPATTPEGRWETCMTMNTSWGFVPQDDTYKSTTEIVHTLAETTGKGGNLLLNVSPRGDGSLPPEQVGRLEGVAAWMDVNGGAIHDTEAGLEPWRFYGPSTKRGDTIYLICPWKPYEDVVVRGLPVKRVSARHLATGAELKVRGRATAEQELFTKDPIGEVFISLPEELHQPHATVIELTLAP